MRLFDNMNADKLEQLGPGREKSTLKSPAMITLSRCSAEIIPCNSQRLSENAE